ncbi:hypothetical protein C8Q79DRAFT_935719 [Trametes meyenii]|nr:hypothetical protein C8Q79DRAFT_935719 [Trametes meyenii]
MSQRVQKGNTVFRPVAKPRPRPSGETRQPSAVPETSFTSRLSKTHEGPAASTTMPPPASITPRLSGDPSLSDGVSDAAEVSLPQSLAITSASVTTPEVYTQRSTPVPSRVPPRISSSQLPSSQTGFAIATPSRNMTRAPPPLSSITQPPVSTSAPNMPVMSVPTHTTGAGPAYIPVEFSFPSQVVASLAGRSSDVPFSIDSSQIDPQLMEHTGFAVTTSSTHQGAPDNEGTEGRLDMGLSATPSIKTSRPRRARQKKPVVGDHAQEGAAQDGGEHSDVPTKRRRPRGSTTDAEGSTAPSSPKRRRWSETTEPRKSRKRAPSPPPFDPEADPGEELDPTAITMAALCDDSGRGRVSSKAAQIVSNHAAWRAANRDRRARMKAIMEAKKYGRSAEDEEGSRDVVNQAAPSDPDAPGPASRAGSIALDPDASASTAGDIDGQDKGTEGFDYDENMAVSRYNVQVRIGANGETIIDEESLFVNRNEEDQTEEYAHVEESDFTKFVNSATYSKKLRGSRWSAEETEMFYDALSQFGENYELISYVLPGRDRKACKNKFKAEDKKDPARITYCLNNRRPYDIETLSRMTGKDFSGPTPEIRAPTPLRSTQLEMSAESAEPTSSRVIRKKSRTPSFHEAGVEIVGDIDEVERAELESIGVEGVVTSV